MRRSAAAWVVFCLFAASHAAERHRVRPEHDFLGYGVVDAIPGMDQVRVTADVPYKTVGEQVLRMDVYAPPGSSETEARPAVVFVNGVGDRPGFPGVRTWGQYTSWPRLVAASGLVAVTFDARGEDANAEDVRDALAFVAGKGRRIAVWACSANVRAALARIAQPGAAAASAAVLYYGSGETALLRPDLPVLLVRAGRDRPEQNAAIDRLATAALAANAPWTVLNVPNGHHAFDVLDDTEESRAAVRATVAFLHAHLDAPAEPPRSPDEARVAAAHLFAGEWPEAEAAYARWVERHPDDADALARLGHAQVELKKPDAASDSLRKALAIDPSIGDAWGMLGRLEADRKAYEAASEALARAIALVPDDPESHFQLGKVKLAQGDAAAAIGSLERSVELFPGNGWAWNSLAYAYLAARQPAKAAASFERVLPHAPRNPTLLYNTACAHALAGNADHAIELLERAVAEGYADKASLKTDPDLAPLRSDPRFAAILKRLG